jgi:soluble lytic murein transglycosylase-like protein
MIRRAAQLLGIMSALFAHGSSADVFAYTDAQGVPHFSNVPADPRYQLLIASPSDDTAGLPPGKVRGWITKSAAYDSYIEAAARTNTVHAALIRAVIVVESGFNPRAVSKRGAKGLMQLLPETARRYGAADVFDPGQNILAGTRYLGDLIVRFDSNLELALAAYNAGEDAVARYGGHIPPYKETLQYVPNVLLVYRALMAQAPAKHG